MFLSVALLPRKYPCTGIPECPKKEPPSSPKRSDVYGWPQDRHPSAPADRQDFEESISDGNPQSVGSMCQDGNGGINHPSASLQAQAPLNKLYNLPGHRLAGAAAQQPRARVGLPTSGLATQEAGVLSQMNQQKQVATGYSTNQVETGQNLASGKPPTIELVSGNQEDVPSFFPSEFSAGDEPQQMQEVCNLLSAQPGSGRPSFLQSSWVSLLMKTANAREVLLNATVRRVQCNFVMCFSALIATVLLLVNPLKSTSKSAYRQVHVSGCTARLKKFPELELASAHISITCAG